MFGEEVILAAKISMKVMGMVNRQVKDLLRVFFILFYFVNLTTRGNCSFSLVIYPSLSQSAIQTWRCRDLKLVDCRICTPYGIPLFSTSHLPLKVSTVAASKTWCGNWFHGLTTRWPKKLRRTSGQLHIVANIYSLVSSQVIASLTQAAEIIHVNPFFANDYYLSFNQTAPNTPVCQWCQTQSG